MKPESKELTYIKSDDFSQSPFRYPGGKFYALKHIMPIINNIPHVEYREVFVGGGSVFFGKKKSKFNWINDIETQIIKTYEAIQNEDHCQSLIDELTLEVATRERHDFYKNMLVSNDFDIAKKTYYLNRTSYSGIINKPAWGYAVGKSSPPENWGKFLRNANKKLSDVKITNEDFSYVIDFPSENGDVLLYLDPPYLNADTKRAYIHPFNNNDHLRLMDMLLKTKHKFCLSYDDCAEIRELYDWANIYEKKWFYNTANTVGNREIGNELIITNYSI